MRALLALGVLVSLGAPPGAALAYVRSTTRDTLQPLSWMHSNCIMVRVNSKGSDDVPGGGAVLAAKRSLENWRLATASCSYLKLQLLDDSPTAVAGFDRNARNENVIVWVESGWPHDRQAAALTTVFFIEKAGSSADGQILDADIELNGEVFRFAVSGLADRTDVENTVTHELGHLLGLDHPCDDNPSDPKVPKDHTGQPIPSCFPVQSLPTWLRETTMFNFADPGETKKRTPEADDIAGVCKTYPTAADPGQCLPPEYRPDGNGCSTAGPHPGLAGLFLLLAMAALAFRRR